MSYINEYSFWQWIIEKWEGLTIFGLQKFSETVRDYVYLILTSQTSMRGLIFGHEARNLDAQRVFLRTFESIVNRRVDIPEDIQRFQKTLQYARSKVDYVIDEFICMLPSDMNLLISLPSFKIGTNLKINLDGEKDKPEAKYKRKGTVRTKPDIESNKEHKQVIRTKPSIKFRKEDNPDMNKITYEEEKVALISGMTSIFTVWLIFK